MTRKALSFIPQYARGEEARRMPFRTDQAGSFLVSLTTVLRTTVNQVDPTSSSLDQDLFASCMTSHEIRLKILLWS